MFLRVKKKKKKRERERSSICGLRYVVCAYATSFYAFKVALKMTNLLFNHFCRCDLEKACKHGNFCLYWFTFKCVILCSVGFWYSISFDGYVCIFSWLKTLTKANVTCILQFTNLITLAGLTCSTSKSQCYLFSFNCLPIGLSYKSK